MFLPKTYFLRDILLTHREFPVFRSAATMKTVFFKYESRKCDFHPEYHKTLD